MRGMSTIYERPGTRLLWVKYYLPGQPNPVRESTKTSDYEEAKEFLKQRIARRTQRSTAGRVEELLDDLSEFYETHRPKSFEDFCRPAVELHLRPYFGRFRPDQVTTPRLIRYQKQRLEEEAAKATINREMALLRKAFRDGAAATPPKVGNVPRFPMFTENNVRKGFLDRDGYAKMRDALPSELCPLFVVAYNVGCRLSELLNLQWDQVNLKDGVITLYPGETKNDDGRIIPITDDMRIVLKRTHLTPWVFHRDGRKIRDFRKSWDIAAKNAGTPDLLFHDLRRSAVRNMVRGGVPEAIAMKISGHKTRAVFERYNIVDDKDIGEAGKMIGRYLKAKKGA
jgi:integrase